jgi:hypothetical protein
VLSDASAPPSPGYTVVIPVFDDWAAASLLVPRLDAAFGPAGLRARVLFVDDGSTASPALALADPLVAIDAIEVLALARNVGHQRAIALGLAWVEANRVGTHVLVMDADGEDDPKDAVNLIAEAARHDHRKVVFARRTRRREGLVFRIGYAAYKLLFRVATGAEISFGNFSVVPWEALRRIARVSEIWNNYAAGVMKSRVPFVTVPTPRSTRLTGESKMNFASLVLHGLSALSVHSDTISVRAVVASGALVAGMAALIAVVVGIRVLTPLAIPGWASSVVGLAVIILLQAISLSSVFAFLVLGTRNAGGFLPSRDHREYVLGVQRVHPAPT